MASRAGSTGNLPWGRGTSRPGVKKAPRGAQHKEAIKQEVKDAEKSFSQAGPKQKETFLKFIHSKKSLTPKTMDRWSSKMKKAKIKDATEQSKGTTKHREGGRVGLLQGGRPKLATKGWK